MIRRRLTLVLGLLLMAAPASAQGTDDELGAVVVALVDRWQSGDAGGVAELGAGSGLDLEVHGQAVGQLTGRRAVAALRHLFGAQETVTVRGGQPSRVAGADNRAFVELTWVIRPGGAQMVERATVFVGFVREGPTWKVSQIRILR
jgi:hypothetical protein